MKKICLNMASIIAFVFYANADTPKFTSFDPVKHGFKFVNDFQNNVISEVDLRTSGLCGGMVYAAMDYYRAGKQIPDQDYRPAEHTVLRRYIYDREVNSLVDNLDKWTELVVNPFGARNDEFFEWGLKGFGGGRLEELRSLIDRNIPAPLGLFKDGNGGTGPHHQVLAIGYDLGRYNGDLGSFKEDLKIFVYDPNHPGQTMTLVPDLANKQFKYKEAGYKKWKTYFVDKKYVTKTPPSFTPKRYPKDGKVYELVVEFGTGGDDLRGGNDNLNAIINLYTGQQQVVNNINGAYRWINNYSQFVCIPLPRPVKPDELKSIDLSTTFGGGISGDNWDMNCLRIRAIGGNIDKRILTKEGRPAFRFTGEQKNYTAIINPLPPSTAEYRGKATELLLEVKTGGDDLRGGNDNLNVTINFSDGSRQQAMNVNDSKRWNDQSTQMLRIVLNRPVAPGDIRSIQFTTTFSGGIGGDNWNMDGLKITAKGIDVSQVIYERTNSPLYRFTKEKNNFLASR